MQENSLHWYRVHFLSFSEQCLTIIFGNAKNLLTPCVVFKHSEISDYENEIDDYKIEIVIRRFD